MYQIFCGLLSLSICLAVVDSFPNSVFDPVTRLDAQVGSHIIFDCELEFPTENRIPYILSWKKDGTEVFSWHNGELVASMNFIGRVHLVDNLPDYGKGSLNLTSIRESDAGYYECKVKFPNRTPNTRRNGTWFYLSVDGGALLKIPPINLTVLEGDSAYLQCVMKYPMDSNLTWFKDGKNILDMPVLWSRSTMEKEGSLRIDPTSMTDVGKYECLVQSWDGVQQSASAYLNIQYKAKVIYSPSEIYFSYGQPATLNCNFRANPPLLTLRWDKDGYLFDSFNVKGVFYQQNGSLYFTKVDESHAGKYSCTPTNALGTEGSSSLMEVIVQHPPVFTVLPERLYFTKIGNSVTFHCDAKNINGKPHPDLIWSKKDGSVLSFERIEYDAGNMTIHNVQDKDHGIYKCSAQNEAATISAESELVIQNIPSHPPYNLTANSSDTAIILKWEKGALFIKRKTMIWYRMVTTQEWRTHELSIADATEAEIKNLEPGKEYEFMILCEDVYGNGVFSKAYRHSTKPRYYNSEPEPEPEPLESFAQVGPPHNLSISEANDGYLITWDAPVFGLDSFRIYILRWYQEPGHKIIGSVQTVNQFHMLKDLEEDCVYTFQVSALSINNYEAFGLEIELVVSAHKRMRAVAIGTITGVIIVVLSLGVFLYIKRQWFLKLHDTESNIKK